MKTLAHEIGHALLHDPEVPATKELTRGLMELEAESTAYVICTALGMDTSDYSFGYVAGWAGGAPEAIQDIKASTSRIQKAATAVLKVFEAEMPVYEVTDEAIVEMAVERSAGVGTMIRKAEHRTQDLVERERVQELTDTSNEGIRAVSVEPPPRFMTPNSYRPLSAKEIEVLDGATESWREFST